MSSQLAKHTLLTKYKFGHPISFPRKEYRRYEMLSKVLTNGGYILSYRFTPDYLARRASLTQQRLFEHIKVRNKIFGPFRVYNKKHKFVGVFHYITINNLLKYGLLESTENSTDLTLGMADLEYYPIMLESKVEEFEKHIRLARLIGHVNIVSYDNY